MSNSAECEKCPYQEECHEEDYQDLVSCEQLKEFLTNKENKK